MKDITKGTWEVKTGKLNGDYSIYIDGCLVKPEENDKVAKLIATAPETKRQRDNLLEVKNKLNVRVNNAENALMHIGNFVSADDVDAQLREAIQTIINNVLFEG